MPKTGGKITRVSERERTNPTSSRENLSRLWVGGGWRWRIMAGSDGLWFAELVMVFCNKLQMVGNGETSKHHTRNGTTSKTHDKGSELNNCAVFGTTPNRFTIYGSYATNSHISQRHVHKL